MLASLLRVVSSILWVPLVLSAVLLAAVDVLRARGRWIRGLGSRLAFRRTPRARPPVAASTKARPLFRTAPAPAAPAVVKPAPDPAAMVAALRRALDTDRELRGRYRYLARLEERLASHGLLVLEKAPLPGLKRALGELEGMVRNWSDPALAELRSRLAVTVTERSSASVVWKASATIAPLARAARNALARASTFRATRAVDLDALTR